MIGRLVGASDRSALVYLYEVSQISCLGVAVCPAPVSRPVQDRSVSDHGIGDLSFDPLYLVYGRAGMAWMEKRIGAFARVALADRGVGSDQLSFGFLVAEPDDWIWIVARVCVGIDSCPDRRPGCDQDGTRLGMDETINVCVMCVLDGVGGLSIHFGLGDSASVGRGDHGRTARDRTVSVSECAFAFCHAGCGAGVCAMAEKTA